jgi:Ni,Fe-hydrogenase maturation factor
MPMQTFIERNNNFNSSINGPTQLVICDCMKVHSHHCTVEVIHDNTIAEEKYAIYNQSAAS